jgi:hypothetical protein
MTEGHVPSRVVSQGKTINLHLDGCEDRPQCLCNPATFKRTKRSPPEYRICSWVSLNIHKYAALADGQSLGLVRLVAGVSARLKSSECLGLTCVPKAFSTQMISWHSEQLPKQWKQ